MNDELGPPTREISGVGAPPPMGPRPMGPGGPGGPSPGRSGGSTAVYAIAGLLLLAGVAGLALLLAGGGDDKSGGGDGTELSSGGDGGDGSDTTAPTTLPPNPAQAAVNDCIQVSVSGGFIATTSCADGSGPFMVTEVVPAGGSCANPENDYIISGDFLLCVQVNLNERYCYFLPEPGSLEWIHPATSCPEAGAQHIVDVIPDATDDSACTTQYEWDFWYEYTNPQMVVCVKQY